MAGLRKTTAWWWWSRRVVAKEGARWSSSSLRERGEALGLKFYQFSFVDLFGQQRSKLVPVARADEIAASGAGFAGFACYLRLAPTDGDVLAKPDPSTLTVLPWNREVGWISCDLEWRGAELDHGPRNVLRRVLGTLRDKYGLSMKCGVECEFFLVDGVGGVSDRLDSSPKPCYDAHALMRRYAVVRELVLGMEALGWGPYQADHEDANGQFEVNWDYADALATADRVAFFKYMTRSVAEKHGLRATFMPKPFADLTGSGCHCHVSLHAPDDKNVCAGEDRPHGLSKIAANFLGGILDAAPALAAVANPTVNSYRRIHASTTTSGATWSPDAVCWGGNNRTVLVRVPEAPRLELRLADMAANPYLWPAALLAAGLNGLDLGSDPGDPADCNMYDATCPRAAAVRSRVPKLPSSLRPALANFSATPAFRDYLGSSTVDAYLELKSRHCDDYDRFIAAHVSPWERDHYLDV
ncbi:hypothetical protein CTAYLR_007800 [Chrysophaeum taylorii]|uniref:Glutamine synthetase n=1 Tax=Chrysophaeum taylorii TaxID=2483200 RepID=A0AAD7XPG8_9STRA|nr:hypothetical protein CTAYLR_007800 [Chrysophaeum taylorii]